ncbi:hypothetical protein BC827DRAFT_1265274 [Russula dissimulans]|nr:hypothetical protein BC827DRAFT_1265274 [Russula dissimulans]
MQLQLLDLPEEILLFVLELAIPPADPRVSLPNSGSLLTCRALHRIGLPILYRTLILKSSLNASYVQRTLLERPTLVRYVRHLYSRAPMLRLLLVLRAICRAEGSLQILDFSVSAPWVSGRLDGSEDEAPPHIGVPVRQLAVRQGVAGNIFLSYYLSSVASVVGEAIERWRNLEVAQIEPHMLLLPGGRPSPVVLALSHSPSLRLLRTALPPAWDPSLLIVANGNPSLRRIALMPWVPPELSDTTRPREPNSDLAAAFLVAQKGVHPWLMEAQNHRRLMELIVAP